MLPAVSLHRMLLLNVSDIHFHYPICKTDMDPDRSYRTRLIQDARDQAVKLGIIDAILVSGDIAYGGAAEEYDAAYEWLAELAGACGCKLERILVVPGNHDVDRKVVLNNLNVRNVHRAIKRAKPHRRQSELFEQFRHPETRSALFAPIGAYNAFAAKFSCQLYTPERLFWVQEIPLDDRTHLRFYGLTSTLLSGMKGRDDKRSSLYLSPLQTVLDPADGIVNVVMCHHPPDWFIDNDEIEDAVRGRAAIQFFGHRHRQRLFRERDFMRFAAAAVNPDRNELGWEPGYNIVKLEMVEKDGHRFLEVEAHLRVWQTNPDMFRAKKESQTEEVFRHLLPVYGLVAAPVRTDKATSVASDTSELANSTVVTGVADLEATMSDERTRNLVLRFWNLASSERREITLYLGIVNEEEIKNFPEAERYGRALRRAGERGLIDKLAEEIARRERK